MITVVEPKQVLKTGNFREHKFHVGNPAALFEIVRSTIYGDARLAVLREYSANAQDANTEASQPERPFEVYLPTMLEPTLRIRDYGFGLSEDQIADVYLGYGSSTKRETNDAIGCLGIGSKAAFSYVEAFMVISYHQGIKTSYSLYLDESQEGRGAVLASERSDEPSGIEVVIPVKQGDTDAFHERAVRLFTHWEPRPQLHHLAAAREPQLKRAMPLLQGAGWEIHPHQCRYGTPPSRVFMGNLPYPLDAEQLELTPVGKALLQECKVLLWAPLGSLHIAGSREALRYSATTKATLQALFLALEQELQQALAAKIASSEHLWEACCRWNELVGDKTGQLPLVVGNLLKEVAWRGRSLQGGVIELPKSFRVVRVDRNNRGRQDWYAHETSSIRPLRETEVFVNDTRCMTWPRKPMILHCAGRSREHFVPLYILHCLPWDPQEQAQLLLDVGLVGMPTRLLSSLPKPERSSAAQITDLKTRRQLFTFDRYSYSDRPADYWDTATRPDLDPDPEEPFLYVGLWEWQAILGPGEAYRAPGPFSEDLRQLQQLGISVPEIYGLKSQAQSRLTPSPRWVPLRKWVQHQLRAELRKPGVIARLRARHQYLWHTTTWKGQEALRVELQRPRGALARYLVQLERARPSEADEPYLSQLERACGRWRVPLPEFKTGLRLHQLYEQLGIVYPLLPRVNTDSLPPSSPLRTAVLEYVNLIDTRRKASRSPQP